MLKKIHKVLIVVVIIFGFTGCTADVSLKFDKNNNIKQTIKISEDIKLLDEFEIPYKKYIDEKIDYNKANSNKYKRDDFKDDTTFGTVYTKDGNDICKELKSSYFSSFFDTIKCTDDDGYYDIFAKTSYTYCPPDAGYCTDAEEVKLTIELPEKAIDNDADYIEDNKYTWVYDRQNKGTLNLKFKKYKTKDKSIKNNKYNYSTLIKFAGASLLGVLIVASVLFVKYKKNKIRY